MKNNYSMKAIYKPKGAAAEYAKYAFNPYKGCSNGCTYCYLKKGIGAKVLGGCTPELVKKFKSEEHALKCLKEDINGNLRELQENGLFMTFISDPFLPKTQNITFDTIILCVENDIQIKTLTKNAFWVEKLLYIFYGFDIPDINLGFTLTGHDELEQNASTNLERITAIEKLSENGYETWASIEPIIDFESSLKMIKLAIEAGCKEFKCGLESGKKYPKKDILSFVEECGKLNAEIIFKKSITKHL